MSRFGIDFATSIDQAKAKELASHGVKFACRYLSTSGNPKNLTANEAKALHAAGLDIVLVFETTGNRVLGGHDKGVTDAKSARTQASTLGAPASVAIYFAVDFDAQPTQMNTVLAYFRGVASILGKDHAGIYAGLNPVKAVLDAGIVTYAWQTYAWSNGRWDARAQLQQYQNAQHLAGLSVDYDRAVKTRYGAWLAKPPITAYTIEYRDKAGAHHKIQTKAPVRWQLRHPRVKRHGRIIQTPVYEP